MNRAAEALPMKKSKQKGEEYPLPTFLQGSCNPQQYRIWVFAKAAAHFARDSARGNTGIMRRAYREAIHQAVLKSGGVDAYTGLPWIGI
jgi:hypothetical protein